jgi:hypothetical protein
VWNYPAVYTRQPGNGDPVSATLDLREAENDEIVRGLEYLR